MENIDRWALLKRWLQQEVIFQYIAASKEINPRVEGLARGMDKVLMKMNDMENESKGEVI